MDFARLLLPIYEDVQYEEVDGKQDKYTETHRASMLQAMAVEEKNVFLEERKKEKNSYSSSLFPITENEGNDEGNTSYDGSDTEFSFTNDGHKVDLLKPDLDVIHEATVFDDSVSHLRYFIDDEGTPGSGKSSPLTARETGNNPLIRHWVNLCNENIQQKRELDMELMGYTGKAGVTWEECANKKLQQLQKEQIRLEQEIKKEYQLLSVVPGGFKLVQELRDQLCDIYRTSMPCYSDRWAVRDGRRMDEEVPDQKVQIPTYHEATDCKNWKDNNGTSNQIVQEEYSLLGNNAIKIKTSEGRREIHDDEKREATLKYGTKKCLNEPIPRRNPVNNGNAMSHLPPIQINSKQILARSFSPQVSKSVCELPDIHDAKKLSTMEETISSSSESSRKASPLRPQNQTLPAVKSANRTTASSMTNQSRTGTSSQMMPNILPPLVNIPKSSKEIRNFFQAPKKKSMSKKLHVSNAHPYDILILEHNNRERNLSANCVPQTKVHGGHPLLKTVTSEPQGQVRIVKNEGLGSNEKSKKAEKKSSGRRNGHH